MICQKKCRGLVSKPNLISDWETKFCRNEKYSCLTHLDNDLSKKCRGLVSKPNLISDNEKYSCLTHLDNHLSKKM